MNTNSNITDEEKAINFIIEISEACENCLQEMYRNTMEFNKKVFNLLMENKKEL